MSMSADNLVGLRYHGVFYTCAISHFHYQWFSKGSVYLNIPILGRVITICDEVFCKFRVSVDGMVTSKKVFSESINRIETHFDMVVEVLKFYISVSFEFYID